MLGTIYVTSCLFVPFARETFLHLGSAFGARLTTIAFGTLFVPILVLGAELALVAAGLPAFAFTCGAGL